MIRLVVDVFSGPHHDLFLIIDSDPWKLNVADSYFLSSFLGIHEEELKGTSEENFKFLVSELLTYWISRIKSVKSGDNKFLLFELSDQYIGGMMLEKKGLNFKVKLVGTDKLTGLDVSRFDIDSKIDKEAIVFYENESHVWNISEEGIINGLELSRSVISTK